MRLQWFPDNFVALCTDNFTGFCFSPTDEDGFSPRFVFPIMITDYKIDVQQTPQISNKMAKEFITLEREYVQNYEKKFSQEVTGRKSSLQNDWLIFDKGIRGRYLFVYRDFFFKCCFLKL